MERNCLCLDMSLDKCKFDYLTFVLTLTNAIHFIS